MKTKTTYYKIDQSLPPKHWYQKRVGWFGKALVMLFFITAVGASSYGYVLNKKAVKSFAAETNAPSNLRTATESIRSDVENIIDVQFVLDRWAKEHPGETWSVTAKGLEGPKFEAHLNQDKTYDSVTAGQLLMTLPLYQQIPVEQHKSIKLDSGQTMATCVGLMVRLGNTDCSREVAGYVDFRKADSALKKIGLTKTTLESGRAKTTAADMTTFLGAVNGEALNKSARESLLKMLGLHSLRTGIPASCPGCSVSNEASESGITHDVAIVQYSGGTYVLSVFTKDGSLDQIRELAGKIQQKIIDTLAD